MLRLLGSARSQRPAALHRPEDGVAHSRRETVIRRKYNLKTRELDRGEVLRSVSAAALLGKRSELDLRQLEGGVATAPTHPAPPRPRPSPQPPRDRGVRPPRGPTPGLENPLRDPL